MSKKGQQMRRIAEGARKELEKQWRIDDMHARYDNGCKHRNIVEDMNGDTWCESCHRPFGSIYDVD